MSAGGWVTVVPSVASGALGYRGGAATFPADFDALPTMIQSVFAAGRPANHLLIKPGHEGREGAEKSGFSRLQFFVLCVPPQGTGGVC